MTLGALEGRCEALGSIRRSYEIESALHTASWREDSRERSEIGAIIRRYEPQFEVGSLLAALRATVEDPSRQPDGPLDQYEQVMAPTPMGTMPVITYAGGGPSCLRLLRRLTVADRIPPEVSTWAREVCTQLDPTRATGEVLIEACACGDDAGAIEALRAIAELDEWSQRRVWHLVLQGRQPAAMRMLGERLAASTHDFPMMTPDPAGTLDPHVAGDFMGAVLTNQTLPIEDLIALAEYAARGDTPAERDWFSNVAGRIAGELASSPGEEDIAEHGRDVRETLLTRIAWMPSSPELADAVREVASSGISPAAALAQAWLIRRGHPAETSTIASLLATPLTRKPLADLRDQDRENMNLPAAAFEAGAVCRALAAWQARDRGLLPDGGEPDLLLKPRTGDRLWHLYRVDGRLRGEPDRPPGSPDQVVSRAVLVGPLSESGQLTPQTAAHVGSELTDTADRRRLAEQAKSLILETLTAAQPASTPAPPTWLSPLLESFLREHASEDIRRAFASVTEGPWGSEPVPLDHLRDLCTAYRADPDLAGWWGQALYRAAGGRLERIEELLQPADLVAELRHGHDVVSRWCIDGWFDRHHWRGLAIMGKALLPLLEKAGPPPTEVARLVTALAARLVCAEPGLSSRLRELNTAHAPDGMNAYCRSNRYASWGRIIAQAPQDVRYRLASWLQRGMCWQQAGNQAVLAWLVDHLDENQRSDLDMIIHGLDDAIQEQTSPE